MIYIDSKEFHMAQGGARPGAGRPPGATNKRSQEIQEKLDKLDCDPIEGMAMIAVDPMSSPELKLQCYKELAQYVAPKRKAVDMAQTTDGNLTIEVVKFAPQEVPKKDDGNSGSG